MSIYVLKADPKEAVKSIYIDLISLKIKITEVYVLEIDSGGYIKHIKEDKLH